MSAHTTFSRNFLVSFADLLTLLLCFFILIYEQTQQAARKHSEQIQEVTEKVAFSRGQEIGTRLAKSKVEEDLKAKTLTEVKVKDVRAGTGVGVTKAQLRKRFELWKEVQVSQLRRADVRGKPVVLESCDKDASIALLNVAEEVEATVSFVPTENCVRRTTLLVKQ